MADLRLAGCASRPLGGYLKALGVLRIVAGQADPAARGRWHDGAFELRSALDFDELQGFFLDRYAPASVVSPWNGGSGFHPKDRQQAIRAIEDSDNARLGPYRLAISAARQSLEHCNLIDKPASEQKAPLVRHLRRIAPDEALDWIEAAVVIRGDHFTGARLLGTGGNDGRFDFSNNYAQCVVDCILAPSNGNSSVNLDAALWGGSPKLKPKLSLAHFNRDSSPNNSPFGEADSLGNPWDLILSVEGSLVLSAGVSRRNSSSLQTNTVAPFTVRPTSAGYGSAVDGESGRAELWLPLWDGWTSHGEVVALAREFRAQVSDHGRLRDVVTGLDLARAAGERGVALGISAFERYALLERAGQSTLAVPVGRVVVKSRPGPAALRGIGRWLSRALSYSESEHCPNGPRIAIDHLRRAAFEMAAGDDPEAACATLEALGEVESSLARSGKAAEALSPLNGAPAAPWITAADDASQEFAVAVAIASLRDGQRDGGPLPAVRDYLHGTRPGDNGATEFDPGRRHAVAGREPVAILAALHARRHVDAARTGHKADQLGYPNGSWAPLDSVRMFASGELDDRRILALLRGLVLLDHSSRAPVPKPTPRQASPQPALELLALSWHAVGKDDPREQRSKDAETLGARRGWAARLAAGATRSVAADAALRLRMVGLPPRLTVDDLLLGADPTDGHLDQGRRLGAALLPHISLHDIEGLMEAQILKRTDTLETKDGQ